MEFLKIILTFISDMAYPLVLAMFLIVFREQIAGALEILRQLFSSVKGGVESGRLALKYGDLTLSATQMVRSDNLDIAAKTIQELLSPAAPLALGYVDNFLGGFVVSKEDEGGFVYIVDDTLGQYNVAKSFTIYIPRFLSDNGASSQSLIHDEYRDEKIKNISIQSKYGRPFTGFAILREEDATLYPVDVPKTLTSIQHVFRFREKQLRVEANMDSGEISELERKNFDEFAKIILERTKSLQESGSIKVIRERSALFSAKS